VGVTLHAQWTINAYTVSIAATTNGTVTVSYNDGSAQSFTSGSRDIAEGTELTVTATPATGYHFDSWTNNGAASVTVDGEKTIGATFAPNTHNVSWVTDGNPLTGEYTNGTTEYGTTIVAPATPTKNATAEYSYTFNGWSPSVDANMPDKDVEYTATWTETKCKYLVRFLNGDEELQSEFLEYGAMPEYKGEAPTKASDLIYRYDFAGWDKPLATVTSATNYRADFTQIELTEFVLVDDKDKDNEYYDVISALALGNMTRTVIYNRTMERGKWHVVSLPFDFDLITHMGHKFFNNVYSYEGATYSAGYLDLHFMPTSSMDANVPYVYYNESADYNGSVNVEDEVFADAEIKAQGDGTVSKDVADGTIDFVNTQYRTQLENGNRNQVYIYNNSLYYPNSNPSSSTFIRAFRGYFQFKNVTISHVSPRMRIVLGGKTVTELDIVSDDAQTGETVRKYIENGVLVIEREGVKYDAQGKRMK
jgi:hypothetical protein